MRVIAVSALVLTCCLAISESAPEKGAQAGSVLSVNKDKKVCVVSMGSDDGVSAGTVLSAPRTGTSLEVTRATATLCVARFDGTADVRRGDKVHLPE